MKKLLLIASFAITAGCAHQQANIESKKPTPPAITSKAAIDQLVDLSSINLDKAKLMTANRNDDALNCKPFTAENRATIKQCFFDSDDNLYFCNTDSRAATKDPSFIVFNKSSKCQEARSFFKNLK